jgi:hypothetical protein
MGRMISLKDEERNPGRGRWPGKVPERNSAGKRESGAGTGIATPSGERAGEYYEPAARMQPPSFVKKYRQRIQGFLWNKAEKQGVADYLKMMDAERETAKRSLQKGPKEVRVLWVHEDAKE